ncbi:TPR repeat-containing protein (plasmid) [Anabaena sp. 90]|uniref:CHAT domain-containing tetratricopeptide repeat protein n=1 Tax=Anabaena sp. 90 TaxID=46234 RepID=UPI00029B71BA|nr:CHAT domain-containing tetratricopeptide repeat protein [Anabaena sp. 90]AFW97184.1 TPR repeat-containing protein [Anabaena sp. 90]
MNYRQLQEQARQLFEQGMQQIRSRTHEAAVNNLNEALNIYQNIQDRQGEAETLFWLGNAYFAVANYDEVINFYNQSLAIAREINYQWLENLVQQALAGFAINNNPQQQEAHRLMEKAFEQVNTGQLEAAEQSLKNALTIYRELQDQEQEARVLGNLGAVCNSLGKFSEAIQYLQQLLEFFSQQPHQETGKADVLGTLGIAYRNLGYYAEAIDCAQQCLTIKEQWRDFQGVSGALESIGLAYYFLGEYDQAIEYYENSLEFANYLQEPRNKVKTLNNTGIVYSAKGDFTKAKDYQEQSLNLAQQIQDPIGKGRSLGNLGNISQHLGDYAQAINYQQQYLDLARIYKDRQGEGIALGGLGLSYYYQEEYTQALNYTLKSLEIAREIKDLDAEGNALNNLGGIHFKFGNFGEAEKFLCTAMQAWESIRARLGDNDAYKVSVFEEQARTYRLLQKVLIAQNKITEALEVAERGRARAFVELLASRLSPTENSESTIASPTLQQIKQIAKAQNATLVEYSIIGDEFKVQGKPGFADSELYIWVIKPTGEIAFRNVDLKPLWQTNNTLEYLVRLTRDSLGVRGREWKPVVLKKTDTEGGDLSQRLKKLHQILIQPIADLLPTEDTAKVIFMPQGSLFLVPFPALKDESGQYLIEKHTILTAPSVQVLQLTRQQQAKVNQAALQEVLVLGNPTMPSLPHRMGEQPQPLNSLPGAKKEAEAIALLFQTPAITGSNGTKKVIVEKMPKARIIHLATHGLLDNVRGLGSAIALAPSGNDNGLLTAEEILDLKLNAELVVLSACDTGRGRLTGDGVIGLSRSFISAGVPSVIVSLWAIPDSQTVELMTNFYKQFQKNADKAESLRQAMLTTMQQYSHPKNWAAFTLIGESH